MHVLNVLQCTNLGGTEQGAFRLMQALRLMGIRLKSFRCIRPAGSSPSSKRKTSR